LVQYIKESINSIINQTFQDWELIIVNDCSTDATSTIIREYENHDHRIRIINNQENMKLPRSLNVGFEAAKSSYLTWTSDDNIYNPKAIEVLHNHLIEHLSCPMVCSGMQIIDDNGDIIEDYPIYDSEEMYIHNMVGACFMYRASVKQTIGLYDITLFGAEDYDYWLRIIKEYGSIDYIPEQLYWYRSQKESLSYTMGEKVRIAWIQTLNKHLLWIKDRIKKPDGLVELYLSTMFYMPDRLMEIWENVKDRIPELKYCKVDIPKNKKILLYGAGKYGKIVSNQIENVSFFVDKNTNIQGSCINGIKVISYIQASELLRGNSEYYPVISVSMRNAYSVIKEMYKKDRNIVQYSFFNCGV
jgi:glycosyltransferase involved in cell wall biosynthesis